MGSVVSGIGGTLNTLTGGGGGGNSGKAGLNYSAGNANIQDAVGQGQADQTWADTQRGLHQQEAFLNALQAQNGLGNQTATFNQLQGVANGTGPNPAQAMLNQSTGQNVANQAALMAGQRGASSNVGLMARQAGMQGANIQQQAAGQAATMQANQSLNALNQMGSLSTSQANQQQNATNAYTNAAQGAQQNVLGAIGAQNNAAVGNMSSQNSANSGIAGVAAQGQQNMLGNIMGGVGAAFMAEGGAVAPVTTDLVPTQGPATAGPQSQFGKWLSDTPNLVGTNSPNAQQDPLSKGSFQTGKAIGGGAKSGFTSLFGSSSPGPTAMAGGADASDIMAEGVAVGAEGGQVPVILSPGEKVLSPAQAKAVAAGKVDAMKVGTTVPGKAKVSGAKNSYANDVVPASAAAGSVVVPRSETQAKNPDKRAEAFVRAVMARNGNSMPKKS